MRHETVETSASGFTYTVSVPQFESFDEALEVIGSQDDVLAILNADQEQNAKQGPKKGVREIVNAIAAEGYSPEDVQAWHDGVEEPPEEVSEAIENLREAVTDAQRVTSEYRLGTPRGDGLTKTASQKIGAALKERMGDDELMALAEEYGIDPSEL